MIQAKHSLRAEDAEFLAIRAMAFIAEDTGRIERFFALTGMTPETLKNGAGDPAILAALLEHLLGDESLLLTFAANTGTDPSLVARAHRILEHGERGSGTA